MCWLPCLKGLLSIVINKWLFFQVFTGNSGGPNRIKYNRLNESILARYIRIVPVAWFNHITMRLEIYGCQGTLLFIISILKSLVIPAIWLALSREYVVYSRLTQFFVLSIILNHIIHVVNRIISVLTYTILALYRIISFSNTKLDVHVKAVLFPLYKVRADQEKGHDLQPTSTKKKGTNWRKQIKYQLRKGALG